MVGCVGYPVPRSLPPQTLTHTVKRPSPSSQIEAAIDVARRLVDAKEMAATPHCQLSPTSVDLGVLGYNEAKV